MDTNTGQLYTPEEMDKIIADAKSETPQDFVRVNRDLSDLEKATMQIRLYSPCACGSWKKFKFCCYTGK